MTIDISKSLPLLPIDTDISIAYAIKAVYDGNANEHQQQKAINWIIERASGVYQPSYRSEKPHDTAFHEGKRAVGLSIVQLVNANLELLQGKIK